MAEMTYTVPDKFANMTINRSALVEPADYTTTREYFHDFNYALMADLMLSGLSGEQIERAVSSGEVNVAHWPDIERPTTDFFWPETETAKEALASLADIAVDLCFGCTADEPIGGNFVTVGAQMGSQQLALSGLIYARVQNRVREVNEVSGPAGPLYIARGTFSEKMFEVMIPEATKPSS